MQDSSSDTESETSEPSSEDSEKESSEEDWELKMLYSKIPIVSKVGGRRYPKVNKKESKYRINVVIREQVVPVYVDTGADICIMSKANAKKLGITIRKTSMKIRPYGSCPKKCMGEFIGTIRFKDRSVNAAIYIIKENVETLLSGSVSEARGIITFNENQEIRNI